MHVDTGHNFAEVIEYRDEFVARVRRPPRRRQRAGSPSTRAGSSRTTGPRASRNRLQSRHPARRDRRARLRRRVRRRPPRRGQGPRQGAHPQLPRPPRPVGPAAAAARAVGRAQRPHPQGRAPACVPAVATGPSSTSGSYIAAERDRRCRASTSPHRARSSRRDGMLLSVGGPVRARARRGAVRGDRPLPHGRRRQLHRRGALRRPPPSTT